MKTAALVSAGFCALCLMLLCASPIDAYPRFQEQIPSIPVVDGTQWPGVGHLARGGGGARNPFGKAFEAVGYKWTPELCREDSDGDGFTNGQELGDPDCMWTPGKPHVVAASHPGLANSVPAAAGRRRFV